MSRSIIRQRCRPGCAMPHRFLKETSSVTSSSRRFPFTVKSKDRSGRNRADREIRRRGSVQRDARSDEGVRLQNVWAAQSVLGKRSREMVSRKNIDHSSGSHRRSARRDRSLHILAGADRSRRRSSRARCAKTIRFNSSMPAISPNGRSAWSRIAKPEFTTQPDQPNALGIGGMLDANQRRPQIERNVYMGGRRFSAQQKVEAWSDMPVWTGKESGTRARRKSIVRLSKGLTFRPLAETARDTLGLVQIASARSTIEVARRSYARTRSRSARAVAQAARLV